MYLPRYESLVRRNTSDRLLLPNFENILLKLTNEFNVYWLRKFLSSRSWSGNISFTGLFVLTFVL